MSICRVDRYLYKTASSGTRVTSRDMPEDQLTLLPPPPPLFLYYFIPNPNTQYKGGLYLNAKFCYSMGGGAIFKNVLFLINNCLGGMSILLLSHIPFWKSASVEGVSMYK